MTCRTATARRRGAWLNYWDATYSNCSANECTTDGLSGSYLSGGLGKLTDGEVATQPWYDVSNAAGTGQYVGWLSLDPTIDFNFGGGEVVNEVKLFVDNSHVGGVVAPVSIVIDGTTYLNPPSATPSVPEIIDITGLHLTGDRVTVTLNNPNSWVFMSEAQFITGAPEPATWVMMLLGFAGLGFMGGVRRVPRRAPHRRTAPIAERHVEAWGVTGRLKATRAESKCCRSEKWRLARPAEGAAVWTAATVARVKARLAA
jgi:hypothetical protein